MTEERARARRGHRKPPSSVAKPRFTAWASSRAFRDASRDARRSSSRSRLSPPPSSPPGTSVEASRNARKRYVTLLLPAEFRGLARRLPFPWLGGGFPRSVSLDERPHPGPAEGVRLPYGVPRAVERGLDGSENLRGTGWELGLRVRTDRSRSMRSRRLSSATDAIYSPRDATTRGRGTGETRRARARGGGGRAPAWCVGGRRRE